MTIKYTNIEDYNIKLKSYLEKLERDRVLRRRNNWILKILSPNSKKELIRVFLRNIHLDFIANNRTLLGSILDCKLCGYHTPYNIKTCPSCGRMG